MADANEKAALAASVGADERQPFQRNPEDIIPSLSEEINVIYATCLCNRIVGKGAFAQIGSVEWLFKGKNNLQTCPCGAANRRCQS